MQPITTAIPYFSESELRCKGSGIIKLDPRFADALPKLRESWENDQGETVQVLS